MISNGLQIELTQILSIRIWVIAQGPSTWVNLRYLEYLRS